MKELEEMGYTLFESEAPDRQKYDFSIADEEDNVAWCWGDDNAVEFECNHPSDCIEYDDDETMGECLLCGQYCEWHNVVDDEDGHLGREPHTWYPRREVGGLMADILGEMKSE